MRPASCRYCQRIRMFCGGRGGCADGSYLKVAVAFLSVSMVIVQLPLIFLQAPDQPAKDELVLGVAMRLTVESFPKKEAHEPV